MSESSNQRIPCPDRLLSNPKMCNSWRKKVIKRLKFKSKGWIDYNPIITHYSFFVPIILYFIHYYIGYSYTNNLKKNNCDCSEGPALNFIKLYNTFMPILLIINTIILIYQKRVYTIVLSFFFILNIIYCFKIHQFVSRTRKRYNFKCECSNSWKKIYLLIYSYIIILSLWIIIIRHFNFYEIIINKKIKNQYF